MQDLPNSTAHALGGSSGGGGGVTQSLVLLDKDLAAQMAGENGQLSTSQAVATSQVPVAVVRGQRLADVAFDSSAAAIALLVMFGMGCCTDTASVKRQLKFPVSLIIGFCCQFILMPVLAFGLAMVLPLEEDVQFGLLCTACVPGGGLGHIAVIIGDADVPLSLTLNLISGVAMLGTAPLWIFVLGQYFQSSSTTTNSSSTNNSSSSSTSTDQQLGSHALPLYSFEIWLAAIFLAYALGLLLNRFRPVAAEMLLNWVIRPFLLLATILYITVGVYINMYVFELINHYAVLGAALLPLTGCLLGCTLSKLCRQQTAFVKTIALETSSLNCLTVLAALRFSLPAPHADLASMVPIWVLFTIPGLYVLLALLQSFYKALLLQWRLRRCAQRAASVGSKDSPSPHHDYDVVSAIVNRPGIAALSAPLVVSDGPEEEAGHSEKVTVL
ncbi:ileal sodium/bile acid cotransporter-like [Babylonia areolata]|uniref:ileal sodium/bile acid cotransporter-like n=1 Tax=Babylonia areolata TaxID=304850 RepID=UPI003FD43852